MRALANDSFCVLKLADFGIVSHGMVITLKCWRKPIWWRTPAAKARIFYRRALPHTELLGGKLHAAWLEEVDNLMLLTTFKARITQVHGQRAAASQDFSPG